MGLAEPRCSRISTDTEYVGSAWDTSPWDTTPWDGRYELVVVDEGTREPAIPIFDRALGFWTHFVYENCPRP